MRVIECNLCGEVLQAANDDDLVGAAMGHFNERHADAGMDEPRMRDMVERDAYDATDS